MIEMWTQSQMIAWSTLADSYICSFLLELLAPRRNGTTMHDVEQFTSEIGDHLRIILCWTRSAIDPPPPDVEMPEMRANTDGKVTMWGDLHAARKRD